MRRTGALIVVLAFALVASGISGGSSRAQADAGVLDACARAREVIDAVGLPTVVEPEECPVEGRPILDGGVGSVVPAPGESVHAEALYPSGAEEIGIARLPDGTIKLDHVGEDSGDEAVGVGDGEVSAGRAGECSDTAFEDGNRRVSETLRYGFNRGSVPSELRADEAEDAVRRAGSRVANTTNNCRMGDRVPVGIAYAGKTARGADIDGLVCQSSDGESVVSFGDLPDGILAATCNWAVVRPGYDRTVSSDVEVNKDDARWTTNPRARGCAGTYDLESVMTHERGHTFGLGHVSEDRHGSLTMSVNINGPCQMVERTLGRGDVLGLENKYD